MTVKYWFAIVTGENLYKKQSPDGWWCMPFNAAADDSILLYCPRSASAARHGVFAEAKVTVPPKEKRSENSYCSGYGLGGVSHLGFAEIFIVERFTKKLTAKHMKEDPLLKNTSLVRRNFQGTCFLLDPKIYQRMKHQLGVLGNDNLQNA